MEFNFANWDFTTWFNQYVPDDVASGSRRGDFARYAFDMVYSYEYQGVSLWNHGGVKMSFKNRLSMQPTYRESDFSPIETVIDDRGEKRNVTTEGGIRFMMKPPDLRFDPAVEPFERMAVISLALLLKVWLTPVISLALLLKVWLTPVISLALLLKVWLKPFLTWIKML